MYESASAKSRGFPMLVGSNTTIAPQAAEASASNKELRETRSKKKTSGRRPADVLSRRSVDYSLGCFLSYWDENEETRSHTPDTSIEKTMGLRPSRFLWTMIGVGAPGVLSTNLSDTPHRSKSLRSQRDAASPLNRAIGNASHPRETKNRKHIAAGPTRSQSCRPLRVRADNYIQSKQSGPENQRPLGRNRRITHSGGG